MTPHPLALCGVQVCRSPPRSWPQPRALAGSGLLGVEGPGYVPRGRTAPNLQTPGPVLPLPCCLQGPSGASSYLPGLSSSKPSPPPPKTPQPNQPNEPKQQTPIRKKQWLLRIPGADPHSRRALLPVPHSGLPRLAGATTCDHSVNHMVWPDCMETSSQFCLCPPHPDRPGWGPPGVVPHAFVGFVPCNFFPRSPSEPQEQPRYSSCAVGSRAQPDLVNRARGDFTPRRGASPVAPEVWAR